ncbi:methyltransferase [Longimycelium tulufanense]|uniref:Methyltransferase n=1 Tax=Longimycelium tulufanense TaxID=907463 RepID=A0A8J3C9W1_9PSEU|nr:methyltransferase [Longimycelium tulufanense]GGM62325.1 methyltransferase [Longimycelium tulufanense]
MAENGSIQDPKAVVSIIYGFALSRITATFVRLGIPDQLADAEKSADGLAAATGCHPDALRRLLRVGVVIGLLSLENGRFRLTPLGQTLRTDAPSAAGHLAAMYSSPPVQAAWAALEQSVRTGRTAFEIANGVPLFEWLERDPELARHFHAAMAAVTRNQLPGLCERYDFSGLRRVVDVGGGDGTLLAAILTENAGLRGTVFDTDKAVETAPEVLARAGVAGRCDIVTGDFFLEVPAGADAYLLKNILHDWDDESCRTILRNCRRVMGNEAKILAVTSLLSGEEEASDSMQTEFAAYLDIEMLVMTGGRERTLCQYEQLFADADLRLGDVTELPGAPGGFVVEALPA